MDLFNPIVTESAMYKHFRSVYKEPGYAPNRAVMNTWADGFIDRDNKFINEFQTTFNSSLRGLTT